MRISGSVLAILLGVVLLSAHLGALTSADAAVVAVVSAIILPRYAVFLLLLIASLQDAPGLAGGWWYVAFVGTGGVVIARGIVLFGRRSSSIHSGTSTRLLGATLVVAAYGLALSFVGDTYLDLAQDPDRSYVVVGGLIAFNVVCAWFSIVEFHEAQLAHRAIHLTLLIILANAVVVALIQISVNPAFFASSTSAVYFEGTNQLTTVTGLGVARITGTFSTPNGFALAMVMLLIIGLAAFKRNRVPMAYTGVFVAVAIGVSVLALSKAMTGFAIICASALVLGIGIRSPAVRYGVIAFSALGLVLMFDTILSREVLESFRVGAISFSEVTYRNLAWSATLDGLELSHWVFGTGLSHWPVFFEENVGFRLSDPHTFVLSYPGTFGLVGVGLFGWVILQLVHRYQSVDGIGRCVIICLLALLLLKDAVSIPYLLGNTPMTWFVWVLLFEVFGKAHERSAHQQQPLRTRRRRKPAKRTLANAAQPDEGSDAPDDTVAPMVHTLPGVPKRSDGPAVSIPPSAPVRAHR